MEQVYYTFQPPEHDMKELRPPDVAKLLGIELAKVRRKMAKGEIKSWLDTKTSNGRKYYVTTKGSVLAYQSKKLEKKSGKENIQIIKRQLQSGIPKSLNEIFESDD